MSVEFSDEQIRRLAMLFATQQRNKYIKFDIQEYPDKVKFYYNFYKNSKDNSLIVENGDYNVDLAVEKFFIQSSGYRKSYYGNKSISVLDNLLNFSKENNKHFETISGIINYKNRAQIAARQSINNWIISNVDVDEKWIELYFKKFWTIEEKQFVLKHLINQDKKEIIERFWKSRATKIKRELIKIVEINRLPFLLDEKDPIIKGIIERRMNEESSKK